jgi:3-oxoacyl-[acyl-carrier protein] reductase
VAVVDQNLDGAQETVDLIIADGGVSKAWSVDVTDEASVTTAVADIATTLGPPVVLVNNAGVIRDNSLRNLSLDDWTTVINVHLRGAFLMSKACQGFMVEARWGRIINLSSTSATGNRGQANYSAAKAGIQGFTKTLALELGKFGVTVNAVAPGFIETDMTRSTAERLGVDYATFVGAAAEATAVKRVGSPEDIAAAIDFFASDDAGFITGQVLYIAGMPHV